MDGIDPQTLAIGKGQLVWPAALAAREGGSVGSGRLSRLPQKAPAGERPWGHGAKSLALEGFDGNWGERMPAPDRTIQCTRVAATRTWKGHSAFLHALNAFFTDE